MQVFQKSNQTLANEGFNIQKQSTISSVWVINTCIIACVVARKNSISTAT